MIVQHAGSYLALARMFGFFTACGVGAVKLWHPTLIIGMFEFLGSWLAGCQATEPSAKVDSA